MKSSAQYGVQDLIVITTGKIGNALFAFIVSVLIARNLGASGFGLFTLSLSVLIITLELVGSEAVDNGLVRFASLYMDKNTNKVHLIFKIALEFKLLSASILLLLGFLFVKLVLASIIGRPELKDAIMYGLAGGCFASFWRYILAILQSYERFVTYAVINVIPNLLKVLFVLFLILANSLNLTYALTINVIVVILGFFAGFSFIPKHFIKAKGDKKDVAFQLFHFSKWIIISNLFFAIYSRLDIFILSYFKDAEILGIYSVALSLITALDLFYVSMLTKLFPQASALTHREEFSAHIKRSLGISSALALLLTPLFFVAEPLILLFFSEKFFDSILIFKFLLFGFLFTLLFNPLLLILYARNKPYLVTIVYFILLPLSFVGNLIFIPMYGAMGAACIVLATRVTGGLLVLFLVYREIFTPDDVSLKQNSP
ncbi:MAG: oligosaccharide flippase family protein [Candidatus Scalinduaceae bacterium]